MKNKNKITNIHKGPSPTGLKTYCTFLGKRMLLADAREAANRHFDTTGVVAAIEYCKEKIASHHDN